MKKLFILSFFIILNTIAMKPDSNTTNNINCYTCMSQMDFIEQANLEMRKTTSVFKANCSEMEEKCFIIKNIFDEYNSYKSKLWDILKTLPKFDSSEFVSYTIELEKKSNDLYKELEGCVSKSISLVDAFLANKKTFKKNLGIIKDLFIYKYDFYKWQDANFINSLQDILKSNKEININFHEIELLINAVKENINRIKERTILLLHRLEENKRSQLGSEQNPQDKEQIEFNRICDNFVFKRQEESTQKNSINESE